MIRGIIVLVCLLSSRGAAAQPLFTDAFPPEEFAARRATVLREIGDAVAVLQGAPEDPSYVKFRQNNQFFYLTGVEVPGALLLLDGRAETATLYLPPRDEVMERSEGPVLVPGAEAARLTGIATVAVRDRFAPDLARAARRPIYVPHRPESRSAATPTQTMAAAAASAGDPWEGRPSRARAFVDKVKAAAAGSEIRDLDPILDRLRVIKSPREIAVIRDATRLSGLAIMEAMRVARPGMFEHELEAIGDYVFKRHNARGAAYFALVAAGANAYYPHYHAGQSRIRNGDLVLYDYGPDYHYYAADVTRQFPANGRFSAAQRELYTAYLRLYQALMQSIRPRVAPSEVLRDAAARMDRIVSAFRFSDDRHRKAALEFVQQFRASRDSLGHYVGMEVHDVTAPFDTLQPGMVFTIEPALTIAEDRIYIRLEDMILVTESGYENLSGFVPVEPDEIEEVMTQIPQWVHPKPKGKTNHE